MLEGDVRHLETALRTGLVKSPFVAVEGNAAFTHPELLERLAVEYGCLAYQAVYDLFGIEVPQPDPEPVIEVAELEEVVEEVGPEEEVV